MQEAQAAETITVSSGLTFSVLDCLFVQAVIAVELAATETKPIVPTARSKPWSEYDP